MNQSSIKKPTISLRVRTALKAGDVAFSPEYTRNVPKTGGAPKSSIKP